MRRSSRLILWLALTAFGLAGCFALERPEASTGAVAAPTLAVPAATEAAPATAASETAVDTIDPAQSEARFIIEEVLRGADTTVVGATPNVAGQIALDLADPAAAQVGTIVISARDIATDNDFRNRAIANEILLTDAHELIAFTPTAVVGLPATAEVGTSYAFQIVGDLTITDQTRSVTFDVAVTPVSVAELRGQASVEIRYADFGLTVPLSQAVQAVEETVILEFNFVALAG